MQLGFVGLGKMGGNMVLRLVQGAPDGSTKGGPAVVGYAKDPNPDLAGGDGLPPGHSLDEMVRRLAPPRAVWVMVPSGNPTEGVIATLAERMAPGDLIVDGG